MTRSPDLLRADSSDSRFSLFRVSSSSERAVGSGETSVTSLALELLLGDRELCLRFAFAFVCPLRPPPPPSTRRSEEDLELDWERERDELSRRCSRRLTRPSPSSSFSSKWLEPVPDTVERLVVEWLASESEEWESSGACFDLLSLNRSIVVVEV